MRVHFRSLGRFLVPTLLITALFTFAAAQSSVTILQGADAITMDPHLIQASPEHNILNHVFEGLVYRDDSMTIRPRLATSWRTLDPLTWEFRLRQGVAFHNGEPFDAEAVKFSFDRAVAQDNADIRNLNLESVEIVDPFTIRLHTTNPTPAMLTALLSGWVVAPGYYAGLPEADAATKPVGTGPYLLTEWRRDDVVILERYTDYWGDSAPHDLLVWRPVPEASTRIAELEVGNADIVVNVPPESRGRVEAFAGAGIRFTPTGRRFYLGLRHDEEGPLQDSRVRRALNHAVDVDLIIDTLLAGLGERRASLLNAPHADASLSPFSYDPELARELLAEAGYADGFEMTIMSPNGRYTKDLEISQAIAGFLREVGIDATVESNEWGHYIDLMLANELRDAWLLGSGSYFDGQLEFNVFMGALEQLTWYNDEAAGLWTELQDTVEESQRVEILNAMQALMLEDPPVIILHKPVELYGVSDGLDWQPRNDGWIVLR